MKQHIKQIMGVTLSAALTVSMGMPAFAASDLEKNETIYSILEPDGSVSSQSVSVHLHREDGLSGVTDESDLSEISCTKGEGGFTQNGQTLTWNVEGSDAYYNGTSDKQSPVSAKITYSLNGKTAPLEELLGQSGKLTITIDLTNHETSTAKIDGKDRQISTPFVTLAAVVLGDGSKNIHAEHGKVENFNGNQAVGFMCLPGIKDSLDGLLPEQLDSLEDLLLDSVTVEADVEELTAPTIMIACATDPESLEDNALDELEDLDHLGEDMDAMNDAMTKLLDGASQVAEGASDLDEGAGKLQEGINQLDSGAARLQEGTSALQQGASTLNSGSVSARDGASQLKSGADSLAAGLNTLQSGAGSLISACQQLQSGSSALAAGLNTLNEKNSALNDGAKQASDGAAALSGALGSGGALNTGAQSFGEALSNAATQGSAAMEQLPPPEMFGQLLANAGIDSEQSTALLTAYAGAYQTAGSLSSGLEQLNGQYGQILEGIQQAGQGADTLQQGVNALSQGVADYTQGVASAAGGANQLENGLAQLGQQLPGLTSGVDELAAGADQLSAGAGSLRDGNAALAEGAAQLAAGIDELAAGAEQLTEGIQALVSGAAELADGTARLKDGANELEDGLRQFDEEAISKLTESIDPDQIAALNETVEEMKERLNEYSSFSGAPEGVQTSAKFIMKTSQPEEKLESDVPEEEQTTESTTSFWDRIVGLFK